jgi:autotransporter-associated beta strand protein
MANEFKVRKSLVINGSGSVLFDVQGSQGQLFSITDSLSGSLFAVKDISGIPVMEAFSDNTVRMGQFGQKVLFISQSRVGIGKEAALTATLDVSGSATVTGSLTTTGNIKANFVDSTTGMAGSNLTWSNILGSNGGEIRITQGEFRYANFIVHRFSQTTDSNGTKDLGLRRNNTGSLEIYDGNTTDGAITNRRDLILRNITGSNATFSGSLSVNGTSTLSGSLAVTGSSTFTGPVNITSGSLTVASASLAVSGSLSINGINITATGGFQQTFSAATTWVVTHNLNTLYPVITVYNESGQVILPTSITATDVNTTTVTFNTAVAGTVNIISGQLQQNIAVSNPTAVAL